MNNTKKYTIGIIFVLVAMIIVWSLLAHQDTTLDEADRSSSFIGTDLSGANKITCTYPQILNTNYLGGVIHHVLPKPELHPIIFTFSNLDNEQGSFLSFIDSTQTITTVPIVKLREDAEKYVFIDGTGENYLSIHTIYKKQAVSTYTKSVSLLGIPSGSLAMGTCIPS